MALKLDEIKPDQITVFKSHGEVELRVHIFNPPVEGPPAGLPGVVFFCGGGWTGGDIRQFYPHSAYLASRGMVAIAAEYRVESRHGTTPRECVKDAKSAIRWVRRHAKDLGIDADRLAAGGGSAGGHVAAAAGTVEGLNEAGEDLSVSCVPNALVLFNPVFDNGPGGFGYEKVQAYWKEISPLHNVDGATPSSIVFLGTEDSLVPVETAERFREKMMDAGIRCDLHLYEGKPHGFFNYGKDESFASTVIKTDRFLASLGYLDGEPTLA